jgi:hypothetical protein
MENAKGFGRERSWQNPKFQVVASNFLPFACNTSIASSVCCIFHHQQIIPIRILPSLRDACSSYFSYTEDDT